MRDNRKKYQVIGLLMIFIMFFSTLGFAALNSSKNEPTASPTPSNQKQIERQTTRLLTDQEKTALMQNGVAILEFLHTKGCQNCATYRPVLEGFYTKYPNVLLVDADSEKDSLQFIGTQTKQITNVTEAGLLDAYCDVSATQTKECILKRF